MFRSAIAERSTIGSAAERALNSDTTFDPGQALLRLVSAGLVVAIDKPEAAA